MPAFNRASGPGQLGQGVIVSQIERVKSDFIEERINTESNLQSYWKTRHEMLYQVEIIYNEPSGNSLRSQFDQFWNSWQELSKYPMENSVRNVLVENAKGMANEITHVFNKLHELRKQANVMVANRTEQINNMAYKIRDLNMAIQKAESLGDKPNDLYDNRDYLIQELSKIVNIQVSRNDADELIVLVGSENLVQGKIVQPLQLHANPDNEGYYDILWQTSGTKPAILGGELKSLLEIRDDVLKQNMDEVDSLAINLATLVNEVHRDGFGLNEETNLNFFEHRPITENIFGNWDSNGDGQPDRSALFKISGVNKLSLDAEVGLAGTITLSRNNERNIPVYIDYQPTDKIKDVINKINISGAGVVAYLNHEGQLALKAKIAEDSSRNNFMIRRLEDSGQFLVGLSGVLKNSGVQGAFSWARLDDARKLQGGPLHYDITPEFHPAQYLKVSDAISGNPSAIAAAGGQDLDGTGDKNRISGKGDGTNALLIASVRADKTIMIEGNSSFEDFFTGMISRTGAQASVSKGQEENKANLLNNLKNLKESQSGVNLDEEMANMVQYQNSYNASARILSTFNQMLEAIIRLGV
jgi:flagellar hook-associated protein 1 FlgK